MNQTQSGSLEDNPAVVPPQLPIDMRKLERSLAYEQALTMLDEMLGLYETGDLREWRDLETTADSDGDEVEQAVQYLEWRGLLERHPDHPHLLSFRDESEPDTTAPGAHYEEA